MKIKSLKDKWKGANLKEIEKTKPELMQTKSISEANFLLQNINPVQVFRELAEVSRQATRSSNKQ